MKLTKLYSNQEHIFNAIFFNDSFNVVYGDIRKPKDKQLDTHNLGKTTLARLLDYMFLLKRNKNFFLFKHEKTFEGFTFFLEIKLKTGSYLTIKRNVSNNSKISFKKHNSANESFEHLPDDDWTHLNVGLDKAKSLLEGWLELDVWVYSYRKIIGYSIRTQTDFNDVFRLSRFGRGKDIDWKPYMADLLGFNGNLAKKHYEKISEVNKLKGDIATLSFSDTENFTLELSKIDNKLLLRRAEVSEIQSFIDKLNFSQIDQEAIESLVAEIDTEIANLNAQEYSIKGNITRIEESRESTQIEYNPKKVQQLFEEAKVVFPDQVSKDFEQLIKFNKAITKERNKYFEKELKEANEELDKIRFRLQDLNKERELKLQFISQTELIAKLRDSNKKIAKIQSEIEFLEKQKENIANIQSLSKEVRKLEKEQEEVKEKIQENQTEINDATTGVFSDIRIFFNSIIKKVLNKEGTITVYLNDNGNFEFETNYQDVEGTATSEGDGFTYHKFLCIAFDLAVSRAYLDRKYPKFLYIDGVFEGLDNRKKLLLLEVLKEYSDLGVQIIITTISSEMSGLPDGTFTNEDIIVTLHDDGQEGRLFKMPQW